ncbi:MAG: type VII secretion protein EccB [Bifidobacteriaceae bacterium]|jgi:type VII secretion protein EccB|nr:type VII secretion protein EccB [Bifidobacteriaceae bacterium]
MATKKEITQSQSFAQRRLLTAFTSGIPGGKELEPAKPMRAVVAGIAIGILIILGGLGFGLLSPSLPEGWENNHLIVVKDSGSRYVSANGIIYPVLNTVSARLVTDPGSFQSISVNAKQLDGVPRGPAIGIVGAPDELPARDRLIGAPWVACLAPNEDGSNGIAAFLSAADPAADPTKASLLVHVDGEDGQDWLIASGRRYPIDTAAVAGVARALSLTSQAPVTVPGAWLNLFAPGAKLEQFSFPDVGGKMSVPVRAGGRELVIGSALTIASGGQQQAYVVTDKSELAQLTPVAAAMYEYGLAANPALAPVEVAASEVAALRNSTEQVYPADWPPGVSDLMEPGAIPCAITTGHPDPGRAAELGVRPPDDELAPGVAVARGYGALALPTDSANGAPSYPYLVDQSGISYGIPKSVREVLAQLGYELEDATAVPRAWIALFAPGPALDPEQAVLTIDPAAPSPGPALPQAPSASVGPDAEAMEPCPGTVGNLIPQVPPAYQLIQGPAAARVATGKGIKVAVVDSGVASAGPHFADAVQDGWDFRYEGGPRPNAEVDSPPAGQVDSPSGKADVTGHGTAVAGLIAARPVKGSGLVGLAPEATIVPVRVYIAETDEAAAIGHAPTATTLAQGIEAAAELGADIINVSMSTHEDNPALRQAVVKAQAAGALIVASSGNLIDATESPEPPPPARDGSVTQVRYPAAYPGVIGVGAATTEEGSVGLSSLRGPQVDIVAPGTSIISTYINNGDCMINGTDQPSTSFAAAYVSGAAAAIASRWPNAGPEYWAYRLQATAVRPRVTYSDQIQGWGVLQVHDALTATLDVTVPGPPLPVASPSQVVRSAQGGFNPGEDQLGVSATKQIVLPVVTLAVAVPLLTLVAGVGRTTRRAKGPAGPTGRGQPNL